jgi:hypothetical protein
VATTPKRPDINKMNAKNCLSRGVSCLAVNVPETGDSDLNITWTYSLGSIIKS